MKGKFRSTLCFYVDFKIGLEILKILKRGLRAAKNDIFCTGQSTKRHYVFNQKA